MALFGGSSSKSTSKTYMTDSRVTAEEVGVQVGASADVAMPGAFKMELGSRAQVGDIIIQEYTPAVQASVEKVVETFAETSQEVTEVLGEKLIETQQGVASILPKMGGYALIGLVVYIVAQRIWK